MAFLDILNIPGLLGTELHSFKRANVYDKLDLGLAGVVALLAGVVLLLNGSDFPFCVQFHNFQKKQKQMFENISCPDQIFSGLRRP